MTLPQIAALMRENLGVAAAPVPTRTMPVWAARLAARFNPRAALRFHGLT